MKSFQIFSKIFPDILWDKEKNQSHVYLTFDDGPHPIYTPQVIEILREYNIKATFFLTGVNVERYGDIASQIFDQGHEIGNHGFFHHKLIFKSFNKLKDELQNTQSIITKTTGYPPTLFRPPYGLFTPKLLRLCKSLNLTVVLWSIMAYDFNLNIPDSRLLNRVSSNVDNGSIIVLHDGHINSHRTVKILPDLIQIILRKDKIFVSL